MIAVILCIILLIVVVWIHYRTEPFVGEANAAIPTLDPLLITNYQTFANDFYNPFLITWQKAIVSSMSADITQEPSTEPSQQPSSTTPPVPPHAEMNAYITNLSQQIGKPLPNITDPLPTTIDITTFPAIAPTIPTDPVPYRYALLWMNQHLTEAHEKLQSALKGESFKNLEGFDNQTCQDLSQCFNDNPLLADQLAGILQSQQKKTQQQITKQIQMFMNDKDLQSALETNKKLVEQSKKVQDQAQSGELLSQLNLPTETDTTYTLPDGHDAMDKMRQNNPTRYKEVQQAAPSMFALKGLTDQINRNLR